MVAGLPCARREDADADPPRTGRSMHPVAAGDGVLQRADRGRLQGRARRLSARGPRVDRTRAPARRLAADRSVARRAPRVAGIARPLVAAAVVAAALTAAFAGFTLAVREGSGTSRPAPA